MLSVALNKAFRIEVIPVNPMLRVELPPLQRKDARALAPDEIQRLREACRGDWTFALIELALTWTDVDWL